MYRQHLTSLYEVAIESRHRNIHLLNEITNSPANINRFYDVYCPWFVLGPSWASVTNWRWSWPQGTGAIINKVPEYEKMVKDKKYPTPLSIYVTGPAEKELDFKRVLMYSMHVPVLNKAEEYLNRYKLLLESLLEKFRKRYTLAAITVERAISENSIWTIETERLPKERSYKVRYKLNDFVVHFILILFAFKQKNLPQRDIFKYGNVLDVLEVLNATVSNRQKKSTKGAAVKKEIPGLIYEDDNVLVVEPPSWAFSRRYFGAPQRHSLVTDGKVVEGATWCTSASTAEHWQKYINNQQTRLYYFVEKSTDKLFAIRTAGGGNDSVKNATRRLEISTFAGDHNDMIFLLRTSNKLSEPGAVEEFKNKVLSIVRGARDSNHHIRQMNEEEGEKIVSIAKELKIFNYKAYIEYFTLEARDQENKIISLNSILDKFNLNQEWVQSHLKFFDILDQ